MAWDDIDDPALNRTLLKTLKRVIKAWEEIYERHKVETFSVFYRKLKELDAKYSESLDTTTDLAAAAEATAASESGTPLKKAVTKFVLPPLTENEKYAFVRIYHRNMDKFMDQNWQHSWFRPLLESVKHAERHGLAAYEKEEDAILATRAAQYAYITVKINKNQDITQTRPKRIDAETGAQLIVMDKIDDSNIVSFNYQGHSFQIKNGILYVHADFVTK